MTQHATAPTMKPYISTTAEQFAPGNFVTEGTSDKVGVTLAIEDPQEANPRVQVRWVRDLTVEWVRSEYLYLADCTCRMESVNSASIDPPELILDRECPQHGSPRDPDAERDRKRDDADFDRDMGVGDEF